MRFSECLDKIIEVHHTFILNAKGAQECFEQITLSLIFNSSCGYVTAVFDFRAESMSNLKLCEKAKNFTRPFLKVRIFVNDYFIYSITIYSIIRGVLNLSRV